VNLAIRQVILEVRNGAYSRRETILYSFQIIWSQVASVSASPDANQTMPAILRRQLSYEAKQVRSLGYTYHIGFTQRWRLQ
jgi:hypothetical protein